MIGVFVMSNRDCVSYWCVAVIAFVCLLLFSVPLVVHAEETVETTETETDLEQDKRLNNLELRLEELGYQINDAGTAIEAITSQMEEERLSISQQLELLLIGVNDELTLLDSIQLSAIDITANLQQFLPAISTDAITVRDDVKQLNALTVSGNASIDSFSDSIKADMKNISEASIEEFNTTLLRTNLLLSYLFVIMLILLVLMITYGIGAVIRNIIKKSIS